MNIELTSENIDRVVALCNRLIQEHVTVDTETLMSGVVLMGQMAKRPYFNKDAVMAKLEQLESDLVECAKQHREIRPLVAASLEAKSLGVWDARRVIEKET
jgi:hypothetical protein